jgi:hypothetical protein
MSSRQLSRQPIFCAWLLDGRHAMRPGRGLPFSPTNLSRSTGIGCRLNWDSNAVLTQHAKILTWIQGGGTAKITGARNSA